MDVAERDVARLDIGDLDADGRLARDRRQHAHVGCRQRVLEVVLEVGHLADLDARLELQFVAGHARAGHGADELRGDVEAGERGDQALGRACDRVGRFAGTLGEPLQQGRVWELPVALLGVGEGQHDLGIVLACGFGDRGRGE